MHLETKLTITLCSVLALAGTALAEDREPSFRDQPDWVDVVSVAAAGSGCSATQDGDAVLYGDSVLEIDFDRMTARTGEGVSLRDSRKVCQFIIELDYPRGWTYKVDFVEGDVYASLRSGTQATAIFSTYFQGQATTARVEDTLTGPLYGEQQIYGLVGGAYAPCGSKRALNFKGEVRATSRSSGWSKPSGRLTLQGPVHAILQWKRC